MTGSSDGATLCVGSSSLLHHRHLPRVRTPRAGLESPPRGHLMSPRTPRRKHGRLAAGAAFTFFSNCAAAHILSGLSSRQSMGASMQEKLLIPSGHGFGRARGQAILAAAADHEAEAETEVLTREASSEYSHMVKEELLLFFFQLDLTTRLQKALNQDQYESAQQIREKIAEVEQEVVRQREAKLGATPSKEEAHEKGLALLRLRGELQRAIEEEKYAEAAGIRDRLAKLEADTLAASAQALAARNQTYPFRLGQKIRHAVFGYRGVICGMDPMCCESEGWMETASIDRLSRGRNQAFYQVLVDMTEPGGQSFLVAYVPEESILLPTEPDRGFYHPYMYLLFYGEDQKGDMIPIKQLREKYNAARHEIPPEGEPGDGGSTEA